MVVGRNDCDIKEFVIVDWIVYQGVLNGGVIGNVLILEWWIGMRCIEIRLLKVSVILCLLKFQNDEFFFRLQMLQ